MLLKIRYWQEKLGTWLTLKYWRVPWTSNFTMKLKLKLKWSLISNEDSTPIPDGPWQKLFWAYYLFSITFLSDVLIEAIASLASLATTPLALLVYHTKWRPVSRKFVTYIIYPWYSNVPAKYFSICSKLTPNRYICE